MPGFPGDATVAVCSAWLGGTHTDLRMLRVLDQFGWKGGFFLKPSLVDAEGGIGRDGLRRIRQAGFSIGLRVDNDSDSESLASARQRLEDMSEGLVLGAALEPGNESMAGAVREAGFAYVQTFRESTMRLSSLSGAFEMPITARALEDHMELRDRMERIEESGEGIFHLGGRVEELGSDDDRWAELECNLAWFCGHQHVWYCSPDALHAMLAP